MSIDIVTYNILAQSLIHNLHVDYEEDLLLRFRLPKILDKITKFIKKNSIICLQEVDYHSLGDIVDLFKDYEYDYVTCYYNINTSYGNMIAFPDDIYKYVDDGCIRVGELIDKDIQSKAHVKARSLSHKLMYLTLRNGGNTFRVYNYHMPVIFYLKQAGMLHAYEIVKHITNSDLPCILCIDLNSEPSSIIYKVLTNDDDIRSKNDVELINCESINYYTNHTMDKNGKEFKETIDYIFCTDDFTVIDSDVIGSTKYVMPNDTEGSDHIPVYSKLKL